MAERLSIRNAARRIRWALVIALFSSAMSACGTSPTDLPTSTPLPAPQNLSVDINGLSMTLSWDPVSGASLYVVYWTQGSTVTTESGTRADAPNPPYLQQARAFGVTYAYIVVAVDPAGRSGRASQLVTATPTGSSLDAPQQVEAAAGDQLVTVSWDAVAGATGYRIEVTTPSGRFTGSDPVAPPFIHDHLTNRTEYAYRVRARFGTTLGSWSEAVTATPMPNEPGSAVFLDVRPMVTTSTNLDGSLTATGAILLWWSSALDATDYQVYVRTDPAGAEHPLIGSTPLTNTTYVHTPVDFGVSYWYRVEAINDGVASPVTDPALIESIRASVPPTLTPGVPYTYVIRGFDRVTESADIPVSSVEPASVDPTDKSLARNLSWTPASTVGAVTQRLYRAESAVGPYALIAEFDDLTKRTYRDDGVSPEPVPTGLTLSTQANALSVTWSPRSDAVNGYRLHWWERTPSGALSMGSGHLPTTSYRLDEAQSGSDYTYAVQVEGFSGVSQSVSVTAP
jgi:fibronectin type 3 domain-containing protein